MATDKMIFSSMEKINEDLADYIWSPSGIWDGLLDAGLALGAVLSLFVVARIAYKAMVLEEGIDILGLLRPILIAMVLANWYWVTSTIYAISVPFTEAFKVMYEYQANKLSELREKRTYAATHLGKRVREEKAKADFVKMIDDGVEKEDTQDNGIENKQGDVSVDIADKFNDIYYSDDKKIISNPMIISSAYNSQYMEAIIMWVGELLWEVSTYFIFLLKNIFLAVLVFFGPITIACSILPVWGDAWSQWIGRMVSVSMYGALAYLIMSFAMMLIEFGLDADITILENAGKEENVFWTMVKFNGSSWGTLSMYLIALLTGALALRAVPELATWIIPAESIRGAGIFLGGTIQAATAAGTAAAKVAIIAVTAGVGGAAAGGSAGAGTGAGEAVGSGTASGTGAGVEPGATGSAMAGNGINAEELGMDGTETEKWKDHIKDEEENPGSNEEKEEIPPQDNREEENAERRKKLLEELEEYENAIKDGYEKSFMIEHGYDKDSYQRMNEELDKLEKEIDNINKRKKK